MTKDIYNMIIEERNTYASMIDYCCGNKLILNNSIINYDYDNWEVVAGSIYDCEAEEFEDIFQYYIITEGAAFRLVELTNETILYNVQLDVYLLAVKHYGTNWGCIPSDWKAAEEIEIEER